MTENARTSARERELDIVKSGNFDANQSFFSEPKINKQVARPCYLEFVSYPLSWLVSELVIRHYLMTKRESCSRAV